MSITFTPSGVEKETMQKIRIASSAENCVDELSICDMWKTYYESLLNSVQICYLKGEVSRKTDKNTECTRKFSIVSIINSFKHLKGGFQWRCFSLHFQSIIFFDDLHQLVGLHNLKENNQYSSRMLYYYSYSTRGQ